MKNKKESLAIVLMLIIFGAFIFTACEEPCDHIPGPAATCENPQRCTLCNKTMIKALGHDNTEWDITLPETYDAPGEKERTCKICGFVEIQTIAKKFSTSGLDYTQIEGGYQVAVGSATATDIVIRSEYSNQSVIKIADNAFKNKTNITSVTIPSSVIVIGNDAFNGCTNLMSMTMPDSVTTIGEKAFIDCTSLSNINISSNVNAIGQYAFNGCTSITSITIPNDVTIINEGVFGKTGLTSITIHSNITSIYKYAFAMCNSLTTITIPAGVTYVGEYAFQLWSATQTINITPRTSYNVPGWNSEWRTDCNAKIIGGGGQLFS